MKRMYMIISGRVQGVGFRYFCWRIAQEFNVTGKVKNLDNGCVELIIQAEEEKLNQFFAKMLAPQRFIQIEDYSCRYIPVVENEKDFQIMN